MGPKMMNGSFDWVTLTERYGEAIGSPTLIELENAIKELFIADDEEHPDIWIECGKDGGEVQIVEISQSGRVRYLKYSGPNLDNENEYKSASISTQSEALQIWIDFLGGNQN